MENVGGDVGCDDRLERKLNEILRLEGRMDEIQAQVRNHGHAIEKHTGLIADKIPVSLAVRLQQDLKSLCECQASCPQLVRFVRDVLRKKCRQTMRTRQNQRSDRESRCDSSSCDGDDQRTSTDSVLEDRHAVQKDPEATSDENAHMDSLSGSTEHSTGCEAQWQNCSPTQSFIVSSTSSSQPCSFVDVLDKNGVTCSTNSL